MKKIEDKSYWIRAINLNINVLFKKKKNFNITVTQLNYCIIAFKQILTEQAKKFHQIKKTKYTYKSSLD